MSEQKEVKGYKVFYSDWTCMDFQYKVGESYEMEETPIACERGYHFCKRLIDCYDYYTFSPENKAAEVTAYGEIDTKENKQCTNKIRIEREISWKEVLNIVNIGKDCTGIGNSGNNNSGNWNSSKWNSGDWNSGSGNSGYNNSGDWNSGNWNSGDYNSGDYNSGDNNSGDWNSGDWNISNCNNGCFNTQPAKMFMFNKLSSWTSEVWARSEAKLILKYQICAGSAEKLNQEEIFQEQQKNWNQLTQEKKEIIMAIPNFDKKIFKKITGIDVDK